MKKYSKKIALILALSLTLAFAIPALADDTVITGNYKATPISVVIPSNSNAVINPYGLPVDIKNGTTVLATITGSKFVVDTPMAGYNYGPVDLKIGASVIGEPTGDFRLSTEALDPDATTKSGLLYLEVKAASPSDLGYTAGQDTGAYIMGLEKAKIVDVLNGWGANTFTGEGTDSQILVSTRAIKKDNMATIKKATSGTLDATAGCFVARLAGDVVKNPRDEWVPTDGVRVTISWSFDPVT